MSDNRPIGIFDSGVGGLTVVKEVAAAMPFENIVYFGDTARVPYGSKSKDTVTKFSVQIVKYLLKKNVKAIVVACNTVSANCYEELTKIFTDTPIFEMVSFGVKAGLEATSSQRIGVIGTEATIRSNAYERAFYDAAADITVFSKACPLFVPLAEEGWTENSVAEITSEIYLQELLDKEIDALVLGCTHYPLLLNCIHRAVGSVKVVNPAVRAAAEIKTFLSTANMLAECVQHDRKLSFFVSDFTAKFNRISKVVLGKAHIAEKVDLEV
ncbi:MAG: glutamate racemase [Clostridiales bacterium]|nr:glutamate racemase [Clostridiales bacterium]